MIPTIERIIEGLLAGEYTKQQAIGWLHQHAADAGRWLRDDLAAAALQGLLSDQETHQKICDVDHRYNKNNFAEVLAMNAYEAADAMLKARENANGNDR